MRDLFIFLTDVTVFTITHFSVLGNEPNVCRYCISVCIQYFNMTVNVPLMLQ